MTEYSVSSKDTVNLTGEAAGASSEVLDTFTVGETFIGQDQLTEELVSITETYGAPTLHFSESVSFSETYDSREDWYSLIDYITISDTFDASESVIADTTVVCPIGSTDSFFYETFVCQLSFAAAKREAVYFNETFYMLRRFDYQTQNKYYYTPR